MYAQFGKNDQFLGYNNLNICVMPKKQLQYTIAMRMQIDNTNAC